MKRILISLAALAIVGGGSYIAYLEFYKLPVEQHIHAGFVVFVDGKQVDFSNIRYMSLKPCEEHKENLSREEIQHEKAHLHDTVGFVAHSHREEALWGDLFRNINYNVDTSKKITAYVNGKQIDDIFNYPINAYDTLVLLVGNLDEKLLSQAITKEQIIKVEKTSQDCETE